MDARNENRKRLWMDEEDKILIEHVKVHGAGRWNCVAKTTGLKRSGKSCRMRWVNYLSPNVNRDHFSEQEDDLIIRLHKLLGNRWSLIAGRIPGRTDNQVKNYWNSHLSKNVEKYGVITYSMSRVFKETGRCIDKPSIEPSFEPHFIDMDGGYDTRKTIEEVDDSRRQNSRISDDKYECSMFSGDDMSQDLPNLMELLDENFLDFPLYDL